MPRIIFLADDNEKHRQRIRSVLEKGGHTIAVEAKDLDDGLRQIEIAVKAGTEILVTDNQMPKSEDGAKLAGALNKRIPSLLVASISTIWEGNWDDPNYDEQHLHATMGEFGVDINGRDKWKQPDVYIQQFDSVELFAEALEGLTFSLRNEAKLRMYDEIDRRHGLEQEK